MNKVGLDPRILEVLRQLHGENRTDRGLVDVFAHEHGKERGICIRVFKLKPEPETTELAVNIVCAVRPSGMFAYTYSEVTMVDWTPSKPVKYHGQSTFYETAEAVTHVRHEIRKALDRSMHERIAA